MRTWLLAGVVAISAVAPAAAAMLAPNEIQATFFNGQPFTASSGSTKYKMTFATDGKMTREPVGGAGAKSEGTWKLTKEGFCSTWKGAKANCYRVQTDGDNKWSVMKGTAKIATWTK